MVVFSYAKDCSRKTKSAFKPKALKGGYPAYGYRKNLKDKHNLLPDDYAPNAI